MAPRRTPAKVQDSRSPQLATTPRAWLPGAATRSSPTTTPHARLTQPPIASTPPGFHLRGSRRPQGMGRNDPRVFHLPRALTKRNAIAVPRFYGYRRGSPGRFGPKGKNTHPPRRRPRVVRGRTPPTTRGPPMSWETRGHWPQGRRSENLSPVKSATAEQAQPLRGLFPGGRPPSYRRWGAAFPRPWRPRPRNPKRNPPPSAPLPPIKVINDAPAPRAPPQARIHDVFHGCPKEVFWPQGPAPSLPTQKRHGDLQPPFSGLPPGRPPPPPRGPGRTSVVRDTGRAEAFHGASHLFTEDETGARGREPGAPYTRRRAGNPPNASAEKKTRETLHAIATPRITAVDGKFGGDFGEKVVS